ncbi:MAG: hypothetical protein IPP36_01280 [Nitrosomonadales bacterium]|nr:hypothetical protein [Nitrosomonadales bacterium]
MDRNGLDEQKISESKLRLLSSLLSETLKEVMYPRQSKRNKTSIPDQLRQMRDWCKAQGHITLRWNS